MRKQAGDIAISWVKFYRKSTVFWIWQIIKRKRYWNGLSILWGCGLVAAYILESGLPDTSAQVVHFYGSAVNVAFGLFLAILALSILLLLLCGLKYDRNIKPKSPGRKVILIGFVVVLVGVFLMSTRFAVYALSTKATLTDELLTYKNLDTNLSIQLTDVTSVVSDHWSKQVCTPFNFHTKDLKTIHWNVCHLGGSSSLLESAISDRLNSLKRMRPLF